ncbi:MAG: hypothetical protein R2851_20575 [Caldilineaceae bacterium]
MDETGLFTERIDVERRAGARTRHGQSRHQRPAAGQARTHATVVRLRAAIRSSSAAAARTALPARPRCVGEIIPGVSSAIAAAARQACR